jgi:hypothetical protein
MLRLGTTNNFDTFKKKLSIACMEKYKNLGRLIVDETYYTPPAVDVAGYNLASDPHDIEKARLREAHKRRDKEIDDMKVDRISMFAYIISKLSKESLDEIQGQPTWATVETDRDPLALWQLVKASHQILTTSKVASIIKKTAREEYAACKQGPYEHIVDYKRKFDARLDAYVVSGNTAPDKEDVAMDFMYGLDNARWADFKAEIVNDLTKGTLSTQVNDLNKMYILASRRVVVKTGKEIPGGATFATVDGRIPKKQPKDGNENGKSKEQKLAEKLAKMKCFNCGKKGHPAKSCPEKSQEDDEEEPPMAGLTMACCATTNKRRLHEFFEICIDNGSQVNIVDSRLLTNLRTERRMFRSMNGMSQTERVGHLEGFFDCQAADDSPTNILSMARVEDLYPITYSQGESITVHMDDQDVVFQRRDGMYVADFSDWLVEDEDRVAEMSNKLCLITIEERESLYSRKQVRRALEAGEYLRTLGFPSLQDAINIVRDGNVRNIPYGVDDVRRFFDIYGNQVPALRGKTSKKHAKAATMDDQTAKMQLTHQVMVADVMHVCGEKFLVSVSSPLEVLLVKPVKSQSKDCLGTALQAHINTLRSRGFEPERVLVDPHKSLVALQGAYPGVHIDPVGAGDHLDKVDTRIRRLKELMRCVVADLPYSLPKDRVKDLVTYGVSRLNLRSTKALNDETCPRVRLTGIRPEFKQEFGLAFGDYAEVYDPKSALESNDIKTSRTEPCIALYPSSNKNGSWIFFNLKTKTYVRRTQWSKLPTNKLVIAIMNEMAGDFKLEFTDQGDPYEPEQEPPGQTPAMHQPIEADAEMTEEEAVIAFDEGLQHLPDLVGREQDDDSVSESSNSDDEMSESSSDPDDDEQFEAELDEMNRRAEELETDDTGSSEPQDNPGVHLRRTARENAGVQRYDQNYEWNLMNLSVGAAIRNFGDTAREACKSELMQLFVEKKALVPVDWTKLSTEQRKRVVRSHMFLREKYEDGKFVKMKGRIVADGRMQDRTIYANYSSPTASTRSVMTCLKLAAAMEWDLLKVDVGGAFLCAPIDENEEIYMLLDESLASMAADWIPEVAEFVREDGKLAVRVEKAMYGLIQSARLWYDELTRHLLANGFTKCPSDQCVLVKHKGGQEAIIVLLYVDDILIISKKRDDRLWVKDLLEKQYERVTVTESDRLPYLGMTIIKTDDGFEICMQTYIKDILQLHGKKVRDYVTPAKSNLFKVDMSAKPIVEKAKFHSLVAKLLYLGKRGRPDILLPVQYLCTRVKGPTVDDLTKLERVLGYLQLTKCWTRVFERSKIDRVTIFIDASFATHTDGKSQSGCVVFLGKTLVHETCRKQRIITRNSTEAELVALLDHLQEGELVQELLLDLGALCDVEMIERVPLLYQDNQSTISIVTTGGGQARTKYMRVRGEYVKERLDAKECEIKYIKTEEMVADVLTKPLVGEGFHKLARQLLGRTRFQTSYASNRGAKKNVPPGHQSVGGMTQDVTCLNLSCSHQRNKRQK